MMMTPSAPAPSVIRRTWLDIRSVVGMHATAHTQFTGHGQASLVQIDPDHRAAVRAKQLRGELPEDAQPDDDECLTQRRRRAADALHRNGSERHRAGFVEADAVGNARHEVARHPDHLGVMRTLGAGAGDPIPLAKVLEPLTRFEDNAGGRIADGGAGRQLPLHQAPGSR